MNFLTASNIVLCLLSLQIFVLCSALTRNCHQGESLWCDDAAVSLGPLGALLFLSEVAHDLWACMVYKQMQPVQCTESERLK